MDVKITNALEAQMQADELDPQEFIEAFAEWKSGDEYGSYLFGKDGAYISPSLFGTPQAFRHVHLVPITDTGQLAAWNRIWKRRGRKSSDRALVYVDAGRGRYLLIFILSEPDAHSVASMKTQQDKELMRVFLDVAEAFVDRGEIIR